jgi:dolichyl-phosphate-mannose-protein mannosyltransferase
MFARRLALVKRLGRWDGLPRFIILALALLIRLVLLDRPFLPNNEGTATGFAIIHAMNFARYGPWQSRFAGVLNTGVVPKDEWTYYAHHPPLVPLVIAAVYEVAGVSPWSSRLIPAFLSVATTLLLYGTALRRYGQLVAFAAALFYLGAPITIVFGGMPDYINAQLAFFMVATIETYMRWRETGRWSWLALSTLLFIAADRLANASSGPCCGRAPLVYNRPSRASNVGACHTGWPPVGHAHCVDEFHRWESSVLVAVRRSHAWTWHYLDRLVPASPRLECDEVSYAVGCAPVDHLPLDHADTDPSEWIRRTARIRGPYDVPLSGRASSRCWTHCAIRPAGTRRAEGTRKLLALL